MELKTTNEVRYYTDSNAIVAFYEPGLMGQTVFFHIKSHGYEYPRDGAKRLMPHPEANFWGSRISRDYDIILDQLISEGVWFAP